MSDGGASLLKPGVSIRPVINSAECHELIKRLYGFEPLDVRELNGYDDKNYVVEARPREGDAGDVATPICDTPAEKYVLKIMNSLDSNQLYFVEGQNELLLYLGDQGTLCPRPVLNVSKKYYSVEALPSGKHVVRLMVFLPGKIFHEIPQPIPKETFYRAGKYIAQVDDKLQNFYHPVYDTHKTLWTLDSVPELHKFVYAISDPVRRSMVEKTIEEFEARVLNQRSKFTPGMIHGDFNEQNIVVHETDGEWTIAGILDFGDSHYSCYLYELAITMTYMMIVGKDVDVGAYVVSGYTSLKKIRELEFSLLKICVMGRLCQSLVLGAYSILQDPGNAYLLTTAAPGWALLEKLSSLSESEVLDKWRGIVN